jgi:hypothetical protein
MTPPVRFRQRLRLRNSQGRFNSLNWLKALDRTGVINTMSLKVTQEIGARDMFRSPFPAVEPPLGQVDKAPLAQPCQVALLNSSP